MLRRKMNSVVGGYIDPYSGMVFPEGNLPAIYQGMQYPPIIGQNFTFGDGNVNDNIIDVTPMPQNPMTAGAGSPPNSPKGPNKLKNWFSGLGLANSGWNLTGNSKLGIGNTNGKAGLTLAGKNLAPYANLGVGLYQGINAVKGLNDVSKNETDRQKLLSRIKASAAGNPMLSSYLTSDQMSQLGKIKRGYSDSTPSGVFNDLGGILGGAGKGALMGAIGGGLPGAIIGGLGGGINAGINSKNQAITNNTQDLESLYQSLQDAEAQYKRMRTPNFTGLGLQPRYTNQWM